MKECLNGRMTESLFVKLNALVERLADSKDPKAQERAGNLAVLVELLHESLNDRATGEAYAKEIKSLLGQMRHSDESLFESAKMYRLVRLIETYGMPAERKNECPDKFKDLLFREDEAKER